jgi:hypothetical protein
MNKVSKLLTLSTLLATALVANDKNVIEFEKNRISQNPNVKVEEITINIKKELPISGWNGYILDVKAKVGEKEVNAKDIVLD